MTDRTLLVVVVGVAMLVAAGLGVIAPLVAS